MQIHLATRIKIPDFRSQIAMLFFPYSGKKGEKATFIQYRSYARRTKIVHTSQRNILKHAQREARGHMQGIKIKKRTVLKTKIKLIRSETQKNEGKIYALKPGSQRCEGIIEGHRLGRSKKETQNQQVRERNRDAGAKEQMKGTHSLSGNDQKKLWPLNSFLPPGSISRPFPTPHEKMK